MAGVKSVCYGQVCLAGSENPSFINIIKLSLQCIQQIFESDKMAFSGLFLLSSLA